MVEKAVFITGVSGGIGLALVKAYRDAGWRVIGSGRRISRQAFCDAFIEADLDRIANDDASFDQFVADVRSGLNGAQLGALVNNAAVQILSPTESLTPKEWQCTLNVNLTIPFRLSQAFIADLEASQGVILNIGSVHAKATKPQFVAYATSKAALHGLTRALAVDLGARVRVICLAPAAIATPMLMAGFEGRNDDAFKQLESYHPIERIGSPEEVAAVAFFLTSPAAGFATGTTFWLDGGVLSRLHDPA